MSLADITGSRADRDKASLGHERQLDTDEGHERDEQRGCREAGRPPASVKRHGTAGVVRNEADSGPFLRGGAEKHVLDLREQNNTADVHSPFVKCEPLRHRLYPA